MYSKNQKATALELYHKINNVTETARRLGYPTREQLHKWINKENLPSKKRKPVELVNTPEHPRNPPAEAKLFILKRCFELGESVKLVSEETGYTRATIYQWRKRYLKKGAAEQGFSSGSICLVLASHKYEKEDYITDYDDFRAYRGII